MRKRPVIHVRLSGRQTFAIIVLLAHETLGGLGLPCLPRIASPAWYGNYGVSILLCLLPMANRPPWLSPVSVGMDRTDSVRRSSQ